jgi:hypothetical protein
VAAPDRFWLAGDEACGGTAASDPRRLGEPIWGRSGGWELTGGAVHGGVDRPERNGVVVRTQGHRRRRAGCRGSGHRWGPRGGENEGGRWSEMAAVDEVPSVEMMHDVGWLQGLFTAAGSR